MKTTWLSFWFDQKFSDEKPLSTISQCLCRHHTSVVDADVPIAVTGVALLVLFVKLMLLFFAVARVTDALL